LQWLALFAASLVLDMVVDQEILSFTFYSIPLASPVLLFTSLTLTSLLAPRW